MKSILCILIACGAFISPVSAVEQVFDIPRELSGEVWRASWIAPIDAPPNDYGVFAFRKPFDLAEKPSRFVIHLTADNRYRLFVNGEAVTIGPARGDLMHWCFESIDIASLLKAGGNNIAIQVWNFGIYAPFAQFSRRTGLLVQGDGILESVVDTNATWQVRQDESFSPVPLDMAKLGTFITSGHGNRIEAAKALKGWQQEKHDTSDWSKVELVSPGFPWGTGTQGDWLLVPRMIPLMEDTPQTFAAIRRADGVKVSPDFIHGMAPIEIAPGQKVSLLLDQGKLTTAYPEMIVSGGKGAKLRITYAEALHKAEKGGDKGNRDEIEGKVIRGLVDEFLPDGQGEFLFRPLRFRTFRYVQVEIETGSEPLRILHYSSRFTAYPLQLKATFKTGDKRLDNIWQVGWHTQRLCANDIFYDCPYYEQMMYVGDTRIQSLITHYMSGDDRLMRKAIDLFDNSRVSEGLTQSSYPSRVPQFIPPYSLSWIQMLNDYLLVNGDETYVRGKLNATRSILDWYQTQTDPATGLYTAKSWWNFVDWPNEWPWDDATRIGGVPSRDKDGVSSILNLQWVLALRDAATLYRHFDRESDAARAEKTADNVLRQIFKRCWDPKRGLLADNPERNTFSQHANVLLVLADPVGQQGYAPRKLMEHVLADSSLVQCTMYFRFYLNEALLAAGMGDLYLDQLQQWDAMLALGLSTFAERPDPTRSDCHGWSASPNYHFLRIVCGIQPTAPGFGKVRIEPNMGQLRHVSASMPHPLGSIRLQFKRSENKEFSGWVDLPHGLNGELKVNGKIHQLTGGSRFELP
ncbi:MAG: family 78 glycoside hydrolase catalytic domain [Luteolibacter sp.]